MSRPQRAQRGDRRLLLLLSNFPTIAVIPRTYKNIVRPTTLLVEKIFHLGLKCTSGVSSCSSSILVARSTSGEEADALTLFVKKEIETRKPKEVLGSVLDARIG